MEKTEKIASGIGARATRRDEYSDAEIGRKWATFKSAFGIGLSKVFIVSAFCLIFCLPGIAWITVCTMMFLASVGTSLPYGIHDGLGYLSPTALPEGLNTAVILGNIRYYETAMLEFSVLIPCIALAAVGVGGLVYVVRMAINKEPIKVIRHFFTGVKYTWLSSLIGGLLVGAGIMLVMFSFYSFDAAAMGGAVNMGGKVVSMIFSIALLIPLSVFAFYLVTLSATYKMPFIDRVKDALKLTFTKFVSNLLCSIFVGIIVGAAFALIYLFGNTSFGMIFWIVLFFVGFYAVAAIFTVFNAKVFDTCINEDLRERETKAATEAAYAAIRAQKAAGERPKKQKQETAAAFVNPKKKKKNATEKSAPKPAPVQPKQQPKAKGYSSAELAQLEEDKKKVLAEAAEKQQTDEAVDMSLYEDDGE